jgi:DNA primase
MTAAAIDPALIQQIEATIAERGPDRKVGREIPFICPVHDDQDPSASWNPEKQTWFCHVCGPKEAGWYGAINLARLLGIDLPERPQDASPAPPPLQRRVVQTFEYRDAAGQLLYYVDRIEPGWNGKSKEYRPRLPGVAPGDWKRYSLGDAPRLLYRLPELLAAGPAAPVLIPEGEKHVDLLRSWGYVATCNLGGAGKFRPEDAEHLRGRTIILLADNDEAGRKHVDQAGALCRGVAAEIRELRLPSLPPKGDVIDWRDAGGTKEQLDALLATAPLWTPPADPDLLTRIAELEERLEACGQTRRTLEAKVEEQRQTIVALRAAIANDRLGPERLTAIAAAFETASSPDHRVNVATGEVLDR